MIGRLASKAESFARRSPLLRRLAHSRWAAPLKSAAEHWLLPSDTAYARWMADRLVCRGQLYPHHAEPGLLSFLTTVWNTPAKYLQALTQSLLIRQQSQTFEWVVLDNGSSDPDTRAFLEQAVRHDPRVRFFRIEKNAGIVGGMRLCLERATGRYVAPLDSDDTIYPDCVSILATAIQQHNHPPLLYTDEDHRRADRPVLPYFKPAWDPVLFLNSAYIAHLGVLDRRLALDLGVYTDSRANGCHDWDTFLRFLAQGHVPVHVPEVCYSWRKHPQSTASNIHSKGYIHASQQSVLNGALASLSNPERYELTASPLFAGMPEWWIRRRHVVHRRLLTLVMSDKPDETRCRRVLSSCDYPDHQAIAIDRRASLADVRDVLVKTDTRAGLVCLVSDRAEILGQEWPWEALALMEIHADIAVVGSRIIDPQGRILDAGQHLGFGRGCDCPDRGRSVHDPGYFRRMWKQHSVSAVPSYFCVFDAAFLDDLLRGCPPAVELANLGPWAGAHAVRVGRRVAYSPFLVARCASDYKGSADEDQRRDFIRANYDLLPDTRYYSRHLGLTAQTAYQPVRETERTDHLLQLAVR